MDRAFEIAPGVQSHPGILGGKATIKGRRLALSVIVGSLAAGSSIEETCESYGCTEADVRAALAYAAGLLEKHRPRVIRAEIRRAKAAESS
jgi:uncharacterized protein (DUF433 family)